MKIYELLEETSTDMSFDLISDILKNGNPYYSVVFLILDKSNNLKAGWKNIDFFSHSIRSIWNLLISLEDTQPGNKFVGIVTTKYTVTWYIEFLKKNKIDFNFEISKENGKVNLFI